MPVVASPNCGVEHVLDPFSAPDPPPPGKRQIAAKSRVSAAAPGLGELAARAAASGGESRAEPESCDGRRPSR